MKQVIFSALQTIVANKIWVIMGHSTAYFSDNICIM
jgi:hypothetical protein